MSETRITECDIQARLAIWTIGPRSAAAQTANIPLHSLILDFGDFILNKLEYMIDDLEL